MAEDRDNVSPLGKKLYRMQEQVLTLAARRRTKLTGTRLWEACNEKSLTFSHHALLAEQARQIRAGSSRPQFAAPRKRKPGKVPNLTLDAPAKPQGEKGPIILMHGSTLRGISSTRLSPKRQDTSSGFRPKVSAEPSPFRVYLDNEARELLGKMTTIREKVRKDTEEVKARILPPTETCIRVAPSNIDLKKLMLVGTEVRTPKFGEELLEDMKKQTERMLHAQRKEAAGGAMNDYMMATLKGNKDFLEWSLKSHSRRVLDWGSRTEAKTKLKRPENLLLRCQRERSQDK